MLYEKLQVTLLKKTLALFEQSLMFIKKGLDFFKKVKPFFLTPYFGSNTPIYFINCVCQNFSHFFIIQYQTTQASKKVGETHTDSSHKLYEIKIG